MNYRAVTGNLKLQLYKFNEIISKDKTHKMISIDISQAYLNSINLDIKDLINSFVNRNNLELNIYINNGAQPIATFENIKFDQMYRKIEGDRIIIRVTFKKRL